MTDVPEVLFVCVDNAGRGDRPPDARPAGRARARRGVVSAAPPGRRPHPRPRPLPRARPRLLVGAVLAVMTAGAGCTSAEPDRTERATRSTAKAPATTVAGGGGRTYRPSGPAIELSAGDLVGLSSDGTSAYVAISVPGSAMGCEGIPAPFIHAVPLAGGTAVRATPDTPEAVSGVLSQSADGRRVALVEQCEEFFGGLRVGEEQGATLRGLRAVDVRLESEAAPKLVWSADGTRLFGAGAGHVIAVDPASGAVTVVRKDGDAMAAAELADGSVVTVTSKAVVVGGRSTPGGGWGLALSHDRTKAAVFGDQGLRVVDADGGVETLAPGMVATAAWSPDGAALAFTVQSRLRVVVPGSDPVDVAERVTAVEFSRDGTALVFSQYPSRRTGGPGPTVNLVPLA